MSCLHEFAPLHDQVQQLLLLLLQVPQPRVFLSAPAARCLLRLFERCLQGLDLRHRCSSRGLRCVQLSLIRGLQAMQLALQGTGENTRYNLVFSRYKREAVQTQLTFSRGKGWTPVFGPQSCSSAVLRSYFLAARFFH